MKLNLILALMIIFLLTAGCVGSNSNSISGSYQTSTVPGGMLSDPSAPASDAEKYCLETSQMSVEQHINKDYLGNPAGTNPLVTITGIVTSKCNYPVEGWVELYAYDKYNKMIPGLFQNGVQAYVPISVKPGGSKPYTLTFDMRRIPDNPRDTDPNVSADFKVSAYVTRIVSAHEASKW